MGTPIERSRQSWSRGALDESYNISSNTSWMESTDIGNPLQNNANTSPYTSYTRKRYQRRFNSYRNFKAIKSPNYRDNKSWGGRYRFFKPAFLEDPWKDLLDDENIESEKSPVQEEYKEYCENVQYFAGE